ncbi:MAG: ADOP family duplicated permease, partial [Gemmatimonadaceae bacterium]
EDLLAPATDIYAPLGYNTSLGWACHGCRHLRAVARLRDGVTRAAATQELNTYGASLARRFPADFDGGGMMMTTMAETVSHDVRPALLAVFGAVLLLLLIAGANVANLFLGRAVEREGEFALRTALGAGRGRLVRQVLAESLAVALAGGVLGMVIAWLGAKSLTTLGARTIPRVEHVGLSAPVLLFTVGVTLGVALLAAVFPAVAAARGDVGATIKGGSRQLARGARHRARRGLVIAELSLSLMLLAGTGLLVRSLERLLAVNTGFDSTSRLSFRLSYTGDLPSKEGATWDYFARALETVRAVPGVRDVAITTQLPMSGDFDAWGVHQERAPRPSPADDPSAFRFAVSTNYLQLMGIPLRSGRGFTPQDDRRAPLVAIVNETVARLDFAGRNPIGERIKMGGLDGPWRTIVGIVGEIKSHGLDHVDERQIYIPYDQNSYADALMAMIVRGDGDARTLVAPVRDALHTLDRHVPVTSFLTMEELLHQSTAQRRFALLVFQLFAGVALLLAAVGIYGVMARSVTERQREIGIRTALGAPRERILGLVLRQGGVLIVGGIGLGVAGALALSRVMRALLFQVAPNDPFTLATVSLTLAVVATVAVLVPAWRATRVDAMEALRTD